MATEQILLRKLFRKFFGFYGSGVLKQPSENPVPLKTVFFSPIYKCPIQ